MNIVFSWDDGAVEDKKLVDLHEKYEIPAMLFVPSFNQEGRKVLSAPDIKSLKSELIEFGCHTRNHTYLTSIKLNFVYEEVMSNKSQLEDILGESIDHFCLPGGKYNKEILKTISPYFRSIRTADTMNFRYDPKLLKPSFHFYPRGNKSLFVNALRHSSYEYCWPIFQNFGSEYFSLIKYLLNNSVSQDKYCFIWGHSWELEQYDLWEELEDFFKFITDRHTVNKYTSVIKQLCLGL